MDDIYTQRLKIRELTLDDAAFILKLLNEPAFHKYIGDKGVRTESDAVEYLKKVPFPAMTIGGTVFITLQKNRQVHPLEFVDSKCDPSLIFRI